ncbi:TPA: hypothetical protein ACT9NC_002451, partial [Legionella pneumophila]
PNPYLILFIFNPNCFDINYLVRNRFANQRSARVISALITIDQVFKVGVRIINLRSKGTKNAKKTCASV